jgi:predicted NACHT family NTPase
MIEAGRSSHVTICSSDEFERAFFDFPAYNVLRAKLAFGSAVDSKTGENDARKFIPVRYLEADSSASLGISDLVSRLLRGGRVALTGDFGSGKSRCVREVYESLTGKIREAGAFPVAINLRDHWSSSNALEILAGHLGNVGLASSVDNFVRLLNSGALILLLDGFDEIGTQSYDMRVDDRIALRRHAVRGVRDLVQRSKSSAGRVRIFV